MINLYERVDQRTLRLHQSYLNANFNPMTVVIEDNGFLPNDILSPYKFFSQNTVTEEDPCFFNEVAVPEFWEIEGSNQSAVIKDKGKIRGKIFYKKGYLNRVVASVEWLNDSGNTQLIDYYNQHGFRYAQLLMDDHQSRILKRYFDQNNQEFLVENYVTKDLILKWNNKDLFFDNRKEFLAFYFEQANLSIEEMTLNSFATSFLFIYQQRHLNSKCRIFWQEKIKDALPENMKIALKNIENLKILIPDKEEYHRVNRLVEKSNQHKIEHIGYVYDFVKSNHCKNEVLILTNSDDIPHIDEIAIDNQKMSFHIASKTEMSTKLMQLGKVQNINLYPKMSEENVLDLCQKCDIYLDVNKGKEIFEGVQLAFMHQLILFAYEETIHNKQLINRENTFKIEQYKELSKVLEEMSENQTLFSNQLNVQLQHANSISKFKFQNGIE
ncbi:accessory Sec system glycosylation chaperone GtfB [Staphylococcus saccharolyticus]|uniref:accessory Sec system glycosylation chaperone GtfB n=1 Tax=Staphylococcus saccharolyticus TaxID=33028 RepID=UPI00102DDB15|nr:accessory Sec system glycosylation chaperone GtfB [Staphylococcus saccharolyticus]MBL7573910.1 accessory Sec system glycosylation chaperone GtfB [Staphylococcus saccharolyticus]MBL7584913.1 accessory Sec system glycosylation chaperone GtfB [Staphylococcus saccharolyticus]MBL7639166.1 accessory Sec system glycosylation chaperone GtfB [Staphylococcus saccharolyticus]QRJ68494.1 accessory Sec system glycosylation chaperone GtfB [Staphylococcus saccharolyticus]TAA91810.1 accessory Sec system gly